MGQIANRQSRVFSERGQLSQAIPQLHVKRMLYEWTPIAQFEPRHLRTRKVYEESHWGLFLGFGGRCDCQRTLVIRIAAKALASDSAITIAQCHPSVSNKSLNNKHTNQIFMGLPGIFLRFYWCVSPLPGYKISRININCFWPHLVLEQSCQSASV